METDIREYTFSKIVDTPGKYPISCTIVDSKTGCSATIDTIATVIEGNVDLKELTVSPIKLDLYEGQQKIVNLVFTPVNASNKQYNVEIVNENIVDVVGSTIMAKSPGTATVRFKSIGNPSLFAEVFVKVNKYVTVQQISLPNSVTMKVGDVKDIAAIVLPTNATNNAVSFKAKETSVLKVDEKGQITAIAEGSATIVAYTANGVTATVLVYITSSEAEITSITVPETIEMMVNNSIVIPYKVATPTQTATLAISKLQWKTGDQAIATITQEGVITAVKSGEAKIVVFYNETVSDTVIVTIKPSAAPTIAKTPTVTLTQGGSTTIYLSMIVADDVTAFSELTIVPSGGTSVAASFVDGILSITSTEQSFSGSDTISLTVTDGDGLQATAKIPVEVKTAENKAPWLKINKYVLQSTGCCYYIPLTDLVEDDLTDPIALTYVLNTRDQNVMVSIVYKTHLRIMPVNPNMEGDVIYLTISDGVNTTTESLNLFVGSIPNKAPRVAEIPMQYDNDTMTFTNITMANYVTDDYTTPASIVWTASFSDNIAIKFVNGVAEIKILNPFWNGVEAITFKAQDDEGLMDSTTVYFMRTVKLTGSTTVGDQSISGTWEGAPVFDIVPMRTLGVPSSQFILMVNMSGYDYTNYTWEWNIPGAKGVDQSSLMQLVTFDNPGVYSVSFTVQSVDGQFTKTVTKENLLMVVGISSRNAKVCKGQALTLQASEGLTSYYWTSGGVGSSTTIRPEKTETIGVTMEKGLFTFTDSVTVVVSVPVELMQDSVMCQGTSFDLEAPDNFVSYKWSTGATSNSITIPDEVASYSVTAIDALQCLSIDTFNVTKVNPLPEINLGEDQTPCSVKDVVTLDAGAGYSYLWSDGSKQQTLTLTESTNTVSVHITDNNGCINSDTVTVAFKYPYKEQIGVVTFSQTTENLIIAWGKTVGVNTVSYRVERETDKTDNWEQVGDVVAFSQPALVVDEFTNYERRAYKYRLVTTDGCGNEAISDYHRSMHLNASLQSDEKINLAWTAYEPMEYVTQYRVLRGTEVNSLDTIELLPASNLFETWSETDAYNKDMIYKVVFVLKDTIDENRYKNILGQTVDENGNLKTESGPFSLAMSNIAEAENAKPMAISTVEFPAKVVVYPTKVRNEVLVQISSNHEEKFLVELLNTNGQVVAKQKTNEGTELVVTISMVPFTQGIYTVRVSANDKSTIVKIIK